MYEYDTIYDEMEEKKKAANVKAPEKDKKVHEQINTRSGKCFLVKEETDDRILEERGKGGEGGEVQWKRHFRMVAKHKSVNQKKQCSATASWLTQCRCERG